MECLNSVLQVELTNFCNGNCWYCRNCEMKRKRGYLSLENAEKLAALLEGRQNKIFLHYYGESLLHPNIDKIIEIFLSKGIKSYVFSNGSVLTDEMSDRLIKAKLAGISITVNRFMPLDKIKNFVLKAPKNMAVNVIILNLPIEDRSKGLFVNTSEVLSWYRELKPSVKCAFNLKGASYEYPERVNGKQACSYKNRKKECLLKCANQYSVTWDCRLLSCIKDYEGDTDLGSVFDVLDKVKYKDLKCSF